MEHRAVHVGERADGVRVPADAGLGPLATTGPSAIRVGPAAGRPRPTAWALCLVLAATLAVGHFVYEVATYALTSEFIDFGLNYYYTEVLRGFGPEAGWTTEQVVEMLSGPMEHVTAAVRGTQVRPAGSPGIYPPILYLVLLPFTRVDMDTAAILWLFLSVACGVVGMGALAASLGGRAHPGRAALLGFLFLCFDPVLYTLVMGQMNLVTFCALALAFVWWRRGWAVLAGTAVGIACLTKGYPALLILYFCSRRRWSAVVAAVSVVAVGYAVSITRFGWLLHWVQVAHVATRFTAEIQSTIFNQSVGAFWHMLLTQSGGPRAAEGLVHLPWLARALTVATGLGLVLASWRVTARRPDADRRTLDLSFAVWVALIPLVGWWVEPHHLVVDLVPLAVLLTWGCTTWLGSGLVIVLCVVTGLAYWPDGFSGFHRGWGVLGLLPKLYGALGIWGALVWLLQRRVEPGGSFDEAP